MGRHSPSTIHLVSTQPSLAQPPPNSASHAVLRRARLLRLIDDPFVAPVTLVTAPAGFGKSTLATQWAVRRSTPVAWVTLDAADNSPDAFFTHLAAAIAGAPSGPHSTGPGTPSLDEILTQLQHAVDAGRSHTLILDDYHLIENRDIRQAMDGLIASLPAGAHLVVLSRTLPLLSLGRLRAQGRVREVTEASLRFTPEEAEEVVVAETRDRLTPAQITRLIARTDGWIVGLRLALLALATLDDARIDPFLDGFAEHQWLDDYIVEEVLGGLTAELRTFVLRTAGLGPLSPALCDAALGIDHSAALIDDLARRLVFARRDGTGLTYYALFAEAVARIARRHLPAGELREDRRRAAQWFEGHGQPETAIEHALAGDDLDTAVRLIKTILPWLMDVDWSHSAIYWLRKLPKPIILADPYLAYCFIWSQLLIGWGRQATQILDQVEPTWMASGDPVLQARALACRSYARTLMGEELEPLQALRRQALALLPDEYAVERLHLWSGIAIHAYRDGDDEVADDAFRRAEACAARLPTEQNNWLVLNTIHRPTQLTYRGQLPIALTLYERALRHVPARLRYWDGAYRYRLAAIHLERNDLAAAREQAARYEPRLTAEDWEQWHPEAWIVSAQIKRATGDTETAFALLEKSIASAEEAGVARVFHHARALRAAWWLADGRPDLAHAWERTTVATQLDWGGAFGPIHGRLTRVQLRAAAGDYAAASALARELIAEGTQLKRWAELIPLHVWDAVLQFHLGNRDAALAALRTALNIGIPGGFVRSFFPPGADLRPLLTAARGQLQPDEAAYLDIVLAGVDEVGSLEEPHQPPSTIHQLPALLVPALKATLSPREREVLARLQAGASNQQIAATLFLTERTVKMHVGNLLAKLGVRNRTAAVVHARALGLLD